MDTKYGDRTTSPSECLHCGEQAVGRKDVRLNNPDINDSAKNNRIQHGKGRMAALLLVTALLFGSFVMTGCAPRQNTQPSSELDTASKMAAEQLWEQYVTTAKARDTSAPFRISASLRYATSDSGHRLVLMAWGNGVAPVRMDLEAGVGKVIALIRQDSNSFIAYDPGAHKAYVNKNSSNALLRFGLPIPFGINELGHIMAGRFTEVIPQKYLKVEAVPAGGFAYTVAPKEQAQGAPSTKDASVLKLNMKGQPEEWTVGTGSNRMVMTIAKYDESTSLPGKYSIQYGEDNSAVLIIKERTALSASFTKEQLALDMPEGTEIKPLPHN